MSKNIQIFIACHKLCDVPKDKIYLPLHVGAEGKESFGFTPDNTGENISTLNPIYCELTGLYWAWKNLECDVLGLVHYRRYFTLKSKSFQKEHDELDCVLTDGEAKELMSKYKVILPKKRHYYIETIYNHYSHTFDGHQLDVSRNIIEKKYPQYLDAFDKVMKSRSGYMFNMFIMNKTLSDQYCSWLFDILKDLVKEIGTEGMTDFEKRYAGRISERLFNVWLVYQMDNGFLKKDDVKEIDYMYFGEIDWNRKIKSFLGAKFFNKKYDKSF